MSRYIFQTLLMVALIGLLNAPVEVARRVFRRPSENQKLLKNEKDRWLPRAAR